MTELAERLGFTATDKVVILSCDDLGLCQAANTGVYQALRNGVATSSSLMVPAPWAREAAARYRGEDVGVHLTLTAEFDTYRWGPITHAPSLLDGDGGFPRTVVDAWEHADSDEVRRECRAQIERAIWWGFDVSHLDSHMSVMQRRPEMFDVFVELALDYRLPVRLPDERSQRSIGFPFRKLAAEEGLLFPDRVVSIPRADDIAEIAQQLEPGVTELRFLPAADTPELRAVTDDWSLRAGMLDLLTGPDLHRILDGVRAMPIGFRQLRDAQRA